MTVSTTCKSEETFASDGDGEKIAKELADRFGTEILRKRYDVSGNFIPLANNGYPSTAIGLTVAMFESAADTEAQAWGSAQNQNPAWLQQAVRAHFDSWARLIESNKQLESEKIPLAFEVVVKEVPVARVEYEFKGKRYSAMVHSIEETVNHLDDSPFEFNWKSAAWLALVAGVVALFLI